MEEELKQKLQQSGAELRTMPQNRSILHSTQRTIYKKNYLHGLPTKSCSNRQISYSLTKHEGC